MLRIDDRISVIPVIHGSGDFSVEVRRIMLAHQFDCVAVPLPPSFQAHVEAAIEQLPVPMLVVQREPSLRKFDTQWSPASDAWDDDQNDLGAEFDPDDDYDESLHDELDSEFDSELYDESGEQGDDGDLDGTISYVPIDPCQPVIAAIRAAMGEHIPRAFIDLETAHFCHYADVLPDPYALKKVKLERFSGALLPALMPLPEGQPQHRAVQMAWRLRHLALRYRSILFVCSVRDWPWIRQAYVDRVEPPVEDDEVEATEIYQADPTKLLFMLGELPFITGLYEQAREMLDDDNNLSIDGVKELLLAARQSYFHDFRKRARKITPQTLATCVKYIRNLSLIENRLTPDFYSIVIAAKQTAGDGFALHVAERARDYPYQRETTYPHVEMALQRARLPNGDIVHTINRLPGHPMVWRRCELLPRPDQKQQQDWNMRWNPLRQCSWPPEDELIEGFRARVVERAQMLMGADLARTEKFTTSIKDGIDIRDTLRNWHTGEIYVKVLPPNRGHLDAAVMIFDSPADPRDYPWRTTWFAEHANESTLAFFATHFRQQMVGPGIGLATYGGALFLFPPVHIPDIWQDSRLDFTETLEERLLAAACLHSQSPQIALMSPLPPGPGWRRLARRFKKSWVHVPISSFGDSTVQQLRMVHVLNGHHVRSYAAHFIRRA
ncbi:MAG: hypothetical protein KDA99_28530 [Planctomycetales bacterium]|nr:hypothetical protein [Planctomycetales bacterium]